MEQTELMRRAARVRVMIFDVDGVLTDGSLHYGADGEAMKTFNVMDGLGIVMLHRVGLTTAIISARESPIVSRRAADLGISRVYQGAHDKCIAFHALLADTGTAAHECGYIGDDVIDLPLLCRVGFAVTVPTGHLDARVHAHYTTHAGGGRGAVREVCDLLLRAQGKYELANAPYRAKAGALP